MCFSSIYQTHYTTSNANFKEFNLIISSLSSLNFNFNAYDCYNVGFINLQQHISHELLTTK